MLKTTLKLDNSQVSSVVLRGLFFSMISKWICSCLFTMDIIDNDSSGGVCHTECKHVFIMCLCSDLTEL